MKEIDYRDLQGALEYEIYFEQYSLVRLGVLAKDFTKSLPITPPIVIGADSQIACQIVSFVEEAIQKSAGLTVSEMDLRVYMLTHSSMLEWRVVSECLTDRLEYWRHQMEFYNRQLHLEF